MPTAKTLTCSQFAALKAKQRALRDNFPEMAGLRIHRAISWIGRAEMEESDLDARFIFLWIAFNAAYADEERLNQEEANARAAFRDFFHRLLERDHEDRIYNAVWERFSGPIRLLMNNQYVFNPFWKHTNGVEGYDDWRTKLDLTQRAFGFALKEKDTPRILSFVFDRLYVLRNQILHGAATWNSTINRDQVRDGAHILTFLMPLFVDIMMENPDVEWGQAFYPVV